MELGLSLVKVGDRRREDYGDIDSLAQAIIERLQSYGGNPTTFEACPEMFGEERAA